METASRNERPAELEFLADPRHQKIEEVVLSFLLKSSESLSKQDDPASAVRAGSSLAHVCGTCSLSGASREFQEMLSALRLELGVSVHPDRLAVHGFGSRYSTMHAMKDALRSKQGPGQTMIDTPDVSGIPLRDESDRDKLLRAVEALRFVNADFPEKQSPLSMQERLAILHECNAGVNRIYCALMAPDDVKAGQEWARVAERFSRAQVLSEAGGMRDGFHAFLQNIGVMLYARRQPSCSENDTNDARQILSWMQSRKEHICEERTARRVARVSAAHCWPCVKLFRDLPRQRNLVKLRRNAQAA